MTRPRGSGCTAYLAGCDGALHQYRAPSPLPHRRAARFSRDGHSCWSNPSPKRADPQHPLQFQQAAVVSEVGDLSDNTTTLRVAAGDLYPRVLAQLLEAERHAVALAVEEVLTSISCPTSTISLGCLIRFQAISVMCNSPSTPPRSTNAP